MERDYISSVFARYASRDTRDEKQRRIGDAVEEP